MNFDANDPRLTAYALDELDARERGEIESLLAASPEAAAAVEEIRRTAEFLTLQMADDDHDRLAPTQRRRVESVARMTRTVRVRRYAVAASLLLAGTLVFTHAMPALHGAREFWRRSTSPQVKTFANVEAQLDSSDESPVAPSIEPASPVNLAFDPGVNRTSAAPSAGQYPAPQSIVSPLAARSPGPGQDGTTRFARVSVTNDSAGADQAPHGSPDSATQIIRLGEEPQPETLWETAFNTESYDHIADNPFLSVKDSPLSTFSIDVDTAAYANLRRFILSGRLPPKDAVRIEELLNYFSYDYPPPTGDQPFSVNVECAQCPWKPEHRLVRVGLRGRTFDKRERPPSNLVFLIDVSGSMEPANKLPLLKQALALLVPRLDEKDRVAIVVYAGSSGLVLPSTTANNQPTILAALERLQAGGSTNGGQGIELAYKTASEHFIKSGVNRVILCTDGDFNVGVTSQGDLIRLIEDKARCGVFLSVLGFGMGNLKDSMLEGLADKGNGNYAYIDTLAEARKVLVDQMGGTLVTIAKDVKIQVEFNPAVAGAYRLIGYENRILAAQDFNDDRKDAGEIGAGHTVTALYEVVPAGLAVELPKVDPLKYQSPVAQPPSAVEQNSPVRDSRLAPASASGELLTIKLRYKQPDGDTSKLIEQGVTDSGAAFVSASPDFRFAAALAAFGMTLRDSPHKAMCNFSMAEELAMGALGEDRSGYRSEFLNLVRGARAIAPAR